MIQTSVTFPGNNSLLWSTTPPCASRSPDLFTWSQPSPTWMTIAEQPHYMILIILSVVTRQSFACCTTTRSVRAIDHGVYPLKWSCRAQERVSATMYLLHNAPNEVFFCYVVAALSHRLRQRTGRGPSIFIWSRDDRSTTWSIEKDREKFSIVIDESSRGTNALGVFLCNYRRIILLLSSDNNPPIHSLWTGGRCEGRKRELRTRLWCRRWLTTWLVAAVVVIAINRSIGPIRWRRLDCDKDFQSSALRMANDLQCHYQDAEVNWQLRLLFLRGSSSTVPEKLQT